eukprot:2462979-Pyramimonas_sp.AAC.1
MEVEGRITDMERRLEDLCTQVACSIARSQPMPSGEGAAHALRDEPLAVSRGRRAFRDSRRALM